jgi:multidrug efflux pump subunit AcrA (membrane-fusion protein)
MSMSANQIFKNLSVLPKSSRMIYRNEHVEKIRPWWIASILFLIIAFLTPWTQNINSKARVTSLQQKDRPQEVNSAISGKVINWYVREGQNVKKGDTLVQLQEIKMEYLDPELILRTQEQILAKIQANDNYTGKVSTLGAQYNALKMSLDLKIRQIKNKIRQTEAKLTADSMDLVAATNDYNIATLQFERQKGLFDKGLVSLTQLEQRNQAFQSASAKRTSFEIKYANTKQDLANLNIELGATTQEYAEKLSKIEGDRFQTLSQISNTEADIAKLKNLRTSYDIRNDMYTILAPQDGQVMDIQKSGIGEIIKEGDKLLQIVPMGADPALEMFIRPVDQPLVAQGQEVRIIFDGYPAIIFSGWPEQSFGTFTGKIVAVENNVTQNGLFRILVTQDPEDKPWPPSLRMGTGASTITLLNDVPLIYEIWRRINGFPPEFYQEITPKMQKDAK